MIKNDSEIIKLAGGNGGMEGSNAGNQTRQSLFDIDAWGFNPGYCNGFGGGEIPNNVRYALGIWPTPLFPYGIGGSLNRNSQSPSLNIGYGSAGIVIFKYIQVN